MLFGSNQGHTSFAKTEIGMFRKVMFALSCLISLICIFILVSHKNKLRRALSGELLSTGTDGESMVSANTSFIENVFSYFGNVSFLFPLVIAFLGYKLFIKRISLKHLDFFVIALVLLGFNLLVVGLCSIFAAATINSEGSAGGLLGYFFYNAFSSFPYGLSKLLPLAISFLGLFLFTSRGPVWYCDTIGNTIFKLIGRNSREAKEPEENTQSNAGKAERQEVFEKPKIRTEHADGINLKKDLVIPGAGDSSAVSGETHVQSSEQSAYTSFKQSTSTTFGQGSIFKNDIDEQKTETRTSVLKSRSHFQPHSRDSIGERIEPDFGQIGAITQGADTEASGESSQPSSPYISPGEPLSGRGSAQATSRKNAVFGDRDPVTYVSGAYVNSKQFDSLGDSGAAATIITGAGVTVPAQNSTEVNKTIITRVVSQTGSQTNYEQSSASGSSENESKVVYKAGADHLAPAKTIGSPLRKSDVSTVITRTVIGDRVNLNADVQVQEKTGSISGGYSQQSSIITRTVPLDSAYNSTSATSQIYAKEDSTDENVINFADFSNNDDSSQIKVDALTSAFIPTADEVNRLKTPETAPIKESDESYSKYLKGSRGVLGSDSSMSKTQEVSDTDSQGAKSSSVNEESADRTVSQNTFASRMNEIASNLVSEDENYESLSEAKTSAALSPAVNVTQNSSDTRVFQNSTETISQTSPTTAGTASSDPDLGSYLTTPPFESMSSTNGAVPYSNANNRVTMNRPNGKSGAHSSKATVVYARATETSPKHEYDDWRPPYTLLEITENQKDISEEEIVEKCSALNRILGEFNVNAHVANYIVGPVITRFNLSLAPGVKAQQILRLAPDIQRNLVSHNINVLTSVPEGPYVGIELPNAERQIIRLGDVISSPEFAEAEKECILPMCLGKDTKGVPVVADLTMAPHLLIAGTTGSGKSAGLNSMLLTLLLTRSPEELRIIMVDPKTVEFTQYQGLPHLLTPIITDIDATVAALAWLVKEQERRYKLLSLLHFSKISQLNKFIKTENAQGRKVYDPMWSPEMGGYAPELKILPYILLVVDEFADMMAVASSLKKEKSPDTNIGRLAGKARAAGIHLIFATQTPRAEIVNGTIKANMSSRISYTVQSGMESRIVLDETGAENLLGQGDMLVKYQLLRNSRTFRAHGPFSSNEDVANIVQSWIDYAGDPEYVDEITEIEEDEEDLQSGSMETDEIDKRDDLYYSVVDYARGEFQVTSNKKTLSITEIQSQFGIGFPKAKKIRKLLLQYQVIDKEGRVLFDDPNQ
ncbi:MAG: DNA translocase FtsK [Succinivibrio sp.]